MHGQVFHPETVSPQELDDWLARGWFRVGQALITRRVLLNETGLRSTVWTRTPLSDFQFKRSHRKLINRTLRDFRLTVGRAHPDPVREVLYHRYLTVARGERTTSLSRFLHDEGARDVFETQELALWDGDDLAAFSWFDVGERSLQSLIGVYDPKYASRSLGFVSVLLEVRHALSLGLAYHYTGYVLPGDPSMDYKLRVQPIEFWEDESWKPWDSFQREQQAAEQIVEKLGQVASMLAETGFPVEIEEYEPFAHHATRPPFDRLLGEPLYIDLTPELAGLNKWMVVYDYDQSQFRVIRCVKGVVRLRDPDAPDVDVWLVASELGKTRRFDELVRALHTAIGEQWA